jgi:DNA-binding HxlR family transcriptional regulator
LKEEYKEFLNPSCCEIKACPVDTTLKLMGKKFTMHIIRNMLMFKQSRFNQFLDSVEGINPKTLSVRLREMEKDGLITRKIYPETPPRVEYSMTEKGQALAPILVQMAEFSMKYCCTDVFVDGKPRTLKQTLNSKSLKILQ